MFKRVLMLTAVVLVFSACQAQAAVIDSNWVGGDGGECYLDGATLNSLPGKLKKLSLNNIRLRSIQGNVPNLKDTEIELVDCENIPEEWQQCVRSS